MFSDGSGLFCKYFFFGIFLGSAFVPRTKSTCIPSLSFKFLMVEG